MNTRYPHLAAKIYNTPLMLHPEKAEVIEAVLRGHALGAPPAVEAALYRDAAERKSYAVSAGGVAMIPITGTLVNRASGMDALSGLSSYQTLGAQLHAALQDPAVGAVVLAVDSPGGEANGVFDMAAKITAARGQKPIHAMVEGDSYSAAYALSSAADKVFATRTSGIGSIGVIAMHMDQSAKLEKSGIKYTAIIAGERKADMSSHQALSDRGRASIQAMVDDMYGLFTQSVATTRGLSEQVIRDTQAGVFTAPEAQKLGLIDGISTLEAVVADLERGIAQTKFNPRANARTQSQRSKAMSNENRLGTSADDAPVITQAEVDRVRAEAEAQGARSGATAERARIAAIYAHPEAAGREEQASAMALETDLSVEAVAKVLAKSPKVAAVINPLAAAMTGVGNPALAPEAGDAGEDQGQDEAAKIVSLFQPRARR